MVVVFGFDEPRWGLRGGLLGEGGRRDSAGRGGLGGLLGERGFFVVEEIAEGFLRGEDSADVLGGFCSCSFV